MDLRGWVYLDKEEIKIFMELVMYFVCLAALYEGYVLLTSPHATDYITCDNLMPFIKDVRAGKICAVNCSSPYSYSFIRNYSFNISPEIGSNN